MTLGELKAKIAKDYEHFIDPKDLNDALEVVRIEELIRRAQQKLLQSEPKKCRPVSELIDELRKTVQ